MNTKISLTPYGYPRDAWGLLSSRLTAKRRLKMKEVAAKRTNRIRLLLQDIHDPHNISACLRSAEAFGIYNVDQVNLYQKFRKPSKVSRGSYHWLKLHRYTNIASYVEQFKAQGFRIAAGFPSASMVMDDIPITQPVILLFGNEHRGVHGDWESHIDYRFTIPMTGMVESLNISVSTALAMYTLSQKAQKTLAPDQYFISPEEQENLLCDWICSHCRQYEQQLAILRRSAHTN